MKLNETCTHCGLVATDPFNDPDPNGHRDQAIDPCMGRLAGVLYGCCGHGREQGYLYFESGQCLRVDLRRIEQVNREPRKRWISSAINL